MQGSIDTIRMMHFLNLELQLYGSTHCRLTASPSGPDGYAWCLGGEQMYRTGEIMADEFVYDVFLSHASEYKPAVRELV